MSEEKQEVPEQQSEGEKPEAEKLDDIGERFEAFRKQASEAQDVKIEQSDKADESVTEKSEAGSVESPGKDSEEDKPKLVPLDALHQSREKFKKLNLEHREYKQNTEKKLVELESLVKSLQSKKEDGFEDTTSENEKVVALENKIKTLESKLQKPNESSEEEQYKKSAEETRKWIDASDKSLDEAGFPGFKIGYPILAQAMKDAFEAGDLTEADLYDKAQWVEKYKEIFPDVRVKFDKVARTEMENRKKDAKKKASMVSNPGKAPEKKTKKEEDETPKTHDEWVKQSLKEYHENFRKTLK